MSEWMTLTNDSVVLFDEKDNAWFLYSQPVEIVRVDDVSQVLSAIQNIEQKGNEGSYAAGFISYEASPAFDSALRVNPADPDVPLLWFGLYSSRERIELPVVDELAAGRIEWPFDEDYKQYKRTLLTIKEYIENGETYQTNHTIRLHAKSEENPWLYFCSLAQGTCASNAAYIQTKDFAVCSFSPELFFRRQGHEIVFKPMKGTAARGYLLRDDVRQAEWLQGSEKNRAENVMIVDMIRNDIGRVAVPGSVNVPDLFTVEKYPTVWQMTSTVCAEVQVGMVDLLQAVFPCASITGAPKCRTMEIICEQETEPRGVYTGAIGWMGPGQCAEFGVAIRTVYMKRTDGCAVFGVGGGIVWDSEPAAEYEECRMKSLVLNRRQPQFDLLESMLWTDAGGYYLLAPHLERLQEAAHYFAYVFDRSLIEKTVAEYAEQLTVRSKVRLLLSQSGEITLESSVLPDRNEKGALRVCVANEAIYTQTPFVYYKTTNRDIYNRFRDKHAEFDDVLLWNERGELTESCSSNIVVEIGGKLFTPLVRCGLLGGTYRRWMLESGRVQQRVISKDDLPQVSRLFLINSVRGMQECSLPVEGLVE